MDLNQLKDLNEASSLRRPRKLKQHNKFKKWIGISLTILLLIGGLGYIFRKEVSWIVFNVFFAKDIKQTLDQSYKPVGHHEATTPMIVASKPFSVLLLGVDQREDEPARSDTIIYSVIRPDLNKILLVSIPRDTYTEVIGRDITTKINSAYAHGGAKMAIDTVEHLLQHPVDYYATINFYGLISWMPWAALNSLSIKSSRTKWPITSNYGLSLTSRFTMALMR